MFEVDLDVDRARLLLRGRHVGRDAPDLAGEGLLRQRVEGDAHRQADGDLRRIHFVHRRLDVEAGLVDQIDRRWRRHPWRRRCRVFAHLADDLGHRAVERRGQHRAPLHHAGQVHACASLGHVRLRRRARGAARVGLDAGIVVGTLGDEALLEQVVPALRLADGVVGPGADLHRALARGLECGRCQLLLGLLVCVPQLHQQLSLLHPIAFLHRQHLDAATGDRRQPGALAGFDGPGAGVGDRGLDRAAADVGQHHRDRLRASEPPQGGS